MSLKKKAAQVRAAGYKNSGQDSMLAHITPNEAALLKAYGGSGRTDPHTGLPHFDGEGGGDGGGDGGDGGGSGGDGGGDGGLGDAGGFGTGGRGDGDTSGDYGWGGFGGETGDTGWGTSGDFSKGFGGGDEFAAADDYLGSFPSGYSDVYGQASDAENQAAVENSLTPLDYAKKWAKNPVVSVLMGLNPVTKMANAALQGPKGLSGLFGGMIGSAAAGPLGGILGSQLGKSVNLGSGENVGNTNTALGGSQGGGINSTLLGALPGLYGAFRQNGEINSQINGLESLFSQNSPYATQLRQQLERRDAAAGRRSQYGNREVELQAALATQASRMAPTLNQIYSQKANNRNLLLSTLASNKGVQDLLKRGFDGLGSLFSSPGVYSSLDTSGLPNVFNTGGLGNLFNSGDSPDLDFGSLLGG